jgi:hypothetical protein
MQDLSQVENTTANPGGEVRTFRGPGAFRELYEHEITAKARNILRRDSHNSKLARSQDGREEWLIRQSAPGLIDDRRGTKKGQARVAFAQLFHQ